VRKTVRIAANVCLLPASAEAVLLANVYISGRVAAEIAAEPEGSAGQTLVPFEVTLPTL
jgi:hypothetical protein